MTTTISQVRIPAFSVLDKNGVKLDTLEHCFIEKMLINPEQPEISIRASSGQIYQAVYDSVMIPKDLKPGENIKVIASFQKHTYGSFVVIRNLRERKTE